MAPGFKSFHVKRVCAGSPQILKAKVKTYLQSLTGTWLLGPEDYLSFSSSLGPHLSSVFNRKESYIWSIFSLPSFSQVNLSPLTSQHLLLGFVPHRNFSHGTSAILVILFHCANMHTMTLPQGPIKPVPPLTGSVQPWDTRKRCTDAGRSGLFTYDSQLLLTF